jgi:hypothetical protein
MSPPRSEAPPGPGAASVSPAPGIGEPSVGDTAFERQLRGLLLDSAEALPGSVRSRLTQARHAALKVHAAPMRYRLQRWVPAGAMAAAVLALLVVFVPHGRPVTNTVALNGSIEDLDLLTSDVPLTADQSDQDMGYDFYEWAVDAARDTGAAGGSTAAQAAARGS